MWIEKVQTAALHRGHRGTHLLLRRILAAGTAARVLLAGALLAGFSAASAFAAGGPASLALTTTAASADAGCSASHLSVPVVLKAVSIREAVMLKQAKGKLSMCSADLPVSGAPHADL